MYQERLKGPFTFHSASGMISGVLTSAFIVSLTMMRMNPLLRESDVFTVTINLLTPVEAFCGGWRSTAAALSTAIGGSRTLTCMLEPPRLKIAEAPYKWIFAKVCMVHVTLTIDC